MLKIPSKLAATAAVSLGVLGVGACGESSESKATKQACAATSEISAQIKALQRLPVTANFPAETRSSVETITKNIAKLKEAAPRLEAARREELEAANSAFRKEIGAITKSVESASGSSNLQAALKQSEPQIKAALNTLAANYRSAFEALKC